MLYRVGIQKNPKPYLLGLLISFKTLVSMGLQRLVINSKPLKKEVIELDSLKNYDCKDISFRIFRFFLRFNLSFASCMSQRQSKLVLIGVE